MAIDIEKDIFGPAMKSIARLRGISQATSQGDIVGGNSKIVINGKTYNGSNIQIVNNAVFVDGKNVTPDAKEISIHVEGNIDSLKVDSANVVEVLGDVGSVQTMSGDVKCENVSGNVSTMSGDVDCQSIAGNFKSMSGDLKVRK